MQFNNDITRKVAEEAARIMAEAQKGSHPKTEKEKDLAALGHPKDEITHKDVLIGRGVLRKEEKGESCEDEAEEAVDKHEKKMHGKKGEVSKHEKEMHKEEATAKEENKFHKKLDKLVHGTFGKSSDEMKKEEVEQIDELNKSTLQSYAGKVIDKTRTMPQGEKKQKHLTGLGKAMDKIKEKEKANSQKFGKDVKEEVELDEALWPGTPEYEKKFPKESKPGARRKTQDYGYQGKEEEHGETTFKKEVKPAKRGKYGARQNYIRSRKVSGKTLKDDVEVGFVDILEAYDTHGLKFIAAMMREEPDNEEFTKEYEDQKKSMEGKKKQPDVAKASVQAVKQEETEIEEGVLGSIAAGVGSFIGNKIDPTHGEMLRTHGPEVVRQLRYHATNAVNKVKNKIKKEEVEEIEERTLTEPETAKKEEIVKSMKKGVKGFKQRYGERAKSVMYATATKIAKEKA